MTAPPAIVVDAVGKTFRRPQEQMHTFKERALHPFRRGEFDQFRAVEDATFHVTQGECFGIVGRNGSGKSTLLKLIAGIYQASEGEIWVNGRMSTFIELGVGFNPDLAARDNVILNGIMLGLTPSEARERYERVIEFSELGEFETVKLKNYSSGMHVRLAFAVMIQVDADVLLIDEVLAVGDAAFQQKCFDQFNRLRDEGKTIVLVTHDMGAVRRFCHRAMLMERGRIVTSGEPDIVGEHYLEHNFQPEKATARETAPLEERFGDGSAQFTHLWIQTPDDRPLEAAPQGEDLTIKATVRFDADVREPALGLIIEDEQHAAIFATSTEWTGVRTRTYQAGDIAQLTVTFPNVLSPGRYFVTPQISHAGTGDQLIDRYPRMISFMIIGTVSTGAVVQLEHDLSVASLDRLPD